MTRGAKIVAWSASALLAAGMATGAAEAATGSPNPAPSSSATHAGAHWSGKGAHQLRDLRRLAGHVAHGEFVARTKRGWQTIDFQRGVVTAASSTSVTLRSADGFTATYRLDGSSRVRLDRAKATVTEAAQIADGDRGLVLAVKSGNSDTVRLLVLRDGQGSASSSSSGAANS